MISFIALSRYHLVKDPFHTIFLDPKYVKRIVVSCILLIICVSSGLVILYRFTSGSEILPTALCLLIGNRNSSWIIILIHCLIMSADIFSSIFLITIYVKLHIAKLKSNINAGINEGEGHSTTYILVALTNIISWLAIAIIILVTLTWTQYPYEMLVWSFLIVFPLNAMIDPLIFVISKELPKCCPRTEKGKT